MTRDDLVRLQWAKLNAGLINLRTNNPFYRTKFANAGLPDTQVVSLDDFRAFPLTTKAELLADQERHPPYGSNLTRPLDAYVRLHQSSGTSGRKLRWLDTPANWDWMSGLWREIYDAIEIVPGDRFFFPFSFGPFLAFWAAFEGAIDTGHFSLAGGGLTTHARLEAILDHRMTVVATTPTYALGMLDAAQRAGLDLAGSAVRLLLLAGEPGANIPSIRQQLEAGWGARVIDHSGMTEVGSLGIEFYSLPGKLFLIEEHCIAEFLEPGDDRPVPEGEVGELVLTNLGRWDSPLIRYRTGDIVRWRADVAPAGKPYVYLDGGIVGRADDMLYIKGNNVYPSAVESVIRSVGDIAEFAIDVDESVQPARIHITIEPLPDASVDLPHRLERAFQNQLHFRPDIQFVAAGTLPRFELKAQRVRRKR